MAAIDRYNGLVGNVAIKVPCRVIATAPITLSAEQTIDGVAVVTGDRVTVAGQADATENGIYVADTGDWDRAADFDGNLDITTGTIVTVNYGSVNADTWWRVSSASPITIGSSDINFVQSLVSSGSTVSYIQAGASAVEWNIQSKARERISAFDYLTAAQKAAVIAGTLDTSVTTALQALLDEHAGESIYMGDSSLNYKINDELTIASGTTLWAHGASIEQTTNAGVLVNQGTQLAHLSKIYIRGITFIGTQAAVTAKWAVNIRWVDDLTVHDCRFENILPVFTGGLDAEAYADIDIANIQNRQTITNNKMVLTVNCTGLMVPIFVRYAKNWSICGNTLIGNDGATSTQKPAGIEVFGGGCDPSGDGAAGNALKCFNGVMNNNILQNQVAGLLVAQSQSVTVTGNACDNVGEALWACGKDITFSANTIINGDNNAIFQTQGICENVTFDNNAVHIATANNRVFYIGSTWSTTDSPGPITYSNNSIVCDAASLSELNACGTVRMKNNYVKNVHIEFLGQFNIIEVDGNNFEYDLFTADATYQFFLMRLRNWAASNVSVSGGYARVHNNTWTDLTGTWTTGRKLAITDPIASARLEVTDNKFYGSASDKDFILNTSSASVVLTTFYQRNVNAGTVDFTSQNTATTSYRVADVLQTPTFAAGTYTASGSQTWTVAAGDVTQNQYRVDGKIMTVYFNIVTSTVAGTPSTELRIAIPAGRTAAAAVLEAIRIVDAGGTAATGMAAVAASGTSISLYVSETLAANWSAATDTTAVRGKISFPIN